MPKKKSRKRSYRFITFKVYYDTDDDLITWWQDFKAGERSDAIRELIRESLGIQSKRKSRGMLDLPELVEVRQDTRWLVNALSDMPAYLERIIHQVAAHQPAVSHQARAPDEAVRQSEESLNDEQVSRRAKRMKKATW